MDKWVQRLGISLLFTAFAMISCKIPILDQFLATPTMTSTQTPTITPTATPTPTPTPSPTPLPDTWFDLGEKARFYGDWDNALAQYQQALQFAQAPEDIATANLGIGLTLMEAKRYPEALQYLTAFLNQSPEGQFLSRGLFLRAQAFLAMGDDQQAIRDFDQYLSLSPGLLDAFVQEQIGDGLRRLGRPLEAIERYQLALSAPRIGGTLSLQIKIGNAFNEAGQYGQASQKFLEIYAIASDSKTKATMNLMAGRAYEMIGDVEAAYTRYLDSLYSFPTEYETYLGLITLVDAGVVVDEFQRGLVDYYAKAYEPSLAAFNRYIAASPTGSAFYYRGLVRSEMGDPWGALQDFQIVIDSYPQDSVWTLAWFEKANIEWLQLSDPASAVGTYLVFVEAAPTSESAPGALNKAAQISERIGSLEDAASIWSRIPQEYPNSSLAYQAAYLTGITRYRLSLYPEARDAFLLADAIARDQGEKAAARLWVGKTLFEEGNLPGAKETWVMAAVSDPTNYYSERAADLVEGREPFTSRSTFNVPSNLDSARQEAEIWMRDKFVIQGPEPLSDLDSTLASDDRLKRGEELWQLGLYEEARDEFEALRAAYQTNAEATYRLMHEFLKIGLYRSAVFASRNILQLAGMDDAATMDAPIYFNYIRFGFYFSDLIFPESEQYSLDPLFVFSVVRQESLFEGFITSYADARGLMQIIPSTGQEIANQLGWPQNYSSDDLYRSFINVPFGVNYLATQRDLFEGDLYAALSAYNAGPGNALIWKELVPDDPDLYLEVIRLEQPQRYIRTIYEIYDIYCNLYGAS